jgi:hypothetical protein
MSGNQLGDIWGKVGKFHSCAKDELPLAAGHRDAMAHDERTARALAFT